jgi:hypothetical protein
LRSQLVDRILQSRYIAKSTRLHDLLDYLCGQVIRGGVSEIHEQEVGHAVFGRPKDYDTALDNIVRVHASTLRKRLEQYFAEEGREEPLIIELPKGNYAPVFRERTVAAPQQLPAVVEAVVVGVPRRRDVKFAILAAIAGLLACSTLFLLWELEAQAKAAARTVSVARSVRDFWGGVFVPGQKTDVVLDDAALGLFQELDGRPVALSEYFDRSYQRRLAGKTDLATIVAKRQSSYSSVNLLWQLSHTADALSSDWAPHFARDYSFRELKSNRAVLLGNSRSNPWIEPFEARLGIRWQFDAAAGVYYPVDTSDSSAAPDRYRPGGEHPDGYCSIAFLPNLGGTPGIVILSGTGGAASAAAGAFLVDGERMAALRRMLPAGKLGEFPWFEALLRIPSRSRLPKDAQIAICRPVKR